MENLEEILKTEPAVEEAAPAEPVVDEATGKADPPTSRLRDDHGRFAKKDETGVEPPATEPVAPASTEAPPAPTGLPQEEYSALRAVRDENKELKRRIDAIQQQYAQPAPKPQQPAVDFWDDPQAFMSSQMQSFGDTLLQQWEQRQQHQRLDASEKAARVKYADYDDAYEAFAQAVQLNPRLAVELAQVPDPGEFAYRKGKDALALTQFGSVEALLASERAKWEAEVKAAVPAPMATLPPTTAADGSVGARTGPDWSGPKPLSEIIK